MKSTPNQGHTVFTIRFRKTLVLFSVFLLSNVKTTTAGVIDLDDSVKLLNNYTQLEKVLKNETLKNNFKYKVYLNDLNTKTNSDSCSDIQWSLPQGVALRGKTAFVAKCKSNGESSLVYQQLDIKVLANVVTVARAVKFNEVLDASAFLIEEKDITRLPYADFLSEYEGLVGQQSKRALNMGLIVRKDMVEPQPTVRQGDNIKVIIQGQGFKLSTEGVAMQSAQPGQQIRVKTQQGKILTGAVSAQQTIELNL
ncbi:MAG: flagellar basal body P-ring formation chaperone FlgA [Burkholderiales bacterium]|nr:flagellar basal body P-ring formation chaperone FlgA [Burkholderiales bacterium]